MSESSLHLCVFSVSHSLLQMFDRIIPSPNGLNFKTRNPNVFFEYDTDFRKQEIITNEQVHEFAPPTIFIVPVSVEYFLLESFVLGSSNVVRWWLSEIFYIHPRITFYILSNLWG